MTIASNHRWGAVHRLRLESERPARPAIKFVPNLVSAELICWLPTRELRGELPEQAAPKFLVYRRQGADPAIVPLDDRTTSRDPLHHFIHMAWHYGREIIQGTYPEKWSQEVNDSYAVMWFLYRRFHRTNFYASRRFNTRKDFLVDNRHAVFPWATQDGDALSMYPNSLSALIDAGAARASELLVSAPSYAQKLHYGLSAAARLQPSISNGEPEAIQRLIRSSLIAGRVENELSQVEREKIEAKIIEAITRASQSDRDDAQFDAWLLGNSNTLPKQIAKTLKTNDEEARAKVHQYLAEAGVCAMQYVGQCVQALMRDVERGLVDAGIPYDHELFALLYYPQPYFAGLPLILLREKLEFCEGTVESLRRGIANAVDEFHTMLWFYAQLLEDRRRLDRERSRSRVSKQQTFDANISGGVEQYHSNSVNNLIADLVESGDLECSCELGEWRCLEIMTSSATFCCQNCGQVTELGGQDNS